MNMQELQDACARGDVFLVKALLDMSLMPAVPVKLVVDTWDRGHVQTAWWLVYMISSITPRNRRKYKVLADTRHVAAWAGAHGRLDVLRWLSQAFVRTWDTRAVTWPVRAACARSDVAVAMALTQWAWPTAPRARAAQWVFALGCTHGHLGILQQLVAEGLVTDVRFGRNRAFRTACGCGHLDVAKWLLRQGGVNVHCKQDAAFRGACRRGHVRVAQWLVSLGGVDIHARHSVAFKPVYSSRHGARAVAVCRFLGTLNPTWSRWPTAVLQGMRTWSEPRDAWMRAVVR